MKTKLLLALFMLITLLTDAQTCNGDTFIYPTQPSTCTFSYTVTGWIDSLGAPTTKPTSLGKKESICILVDYTGDLLFSINGTFYVAPGVKYTGSVTGFGPDCEILAAGEIDLTNTPTFSGGDYTVGTAGIISVPGTFAPGGDATVHNAGTFNIGGDLNLGGKTSFTNYPDSVNIIQGDSTINAPFNNCGLYELFGSLNSGGSSGLSNLCSAYIHTDMNLNSDYINEGLIILDGNLNFGTAIFYNNGTLFVNSIFINNDKLIGNNDDSILIVRTTASLTSGGIITGHLYFDLDDGGGFDMVCGSCIEDIDILDSVSIPSTNPEILVNCGEDIIINPVSVNSKLDFDGVDDYLSTPTFIDGLGEITIMAWVKSDIGNSTDMTIASEDLSCKLWLQDGNKPTFTIKTAGNPRRSVVSSIIKLDEWHHIAGTFSSTTGILKIYLDGELESTYDTGITGALIESTASSNGSFEIGRYSRVTADQEYFKGDIDEVRVFVTELTADQLQRSVYQEIELNSGNVRGSVIGKDIVDIATDTKISWNRLIAYYPMTNIISFTRTKDYSLSNRYTKLNNITTMEKQTAPMPYESNTDGDWSTEATWVHGDVWDIEDEVNNKDWSIVRLNSNVTTSKSHTQLGMIVENSKTLTVNGDNEINNSWYLELNGTLDLSDDSQLVQGVNSDLVTSASGKLSRRQKGSSNVYWYTYMSSPVGVPAVSLLIDNNTTTNNPNNTAFTFNTLKEGNGSAVQFTTAYNEVGKLSTRWMYTFLNGLTYYDWAHFYATSDLNPGVGYIHKGTGNAGLEQEYTFEGKPNNGTILIAADDVDGDSGNESQPDVTQTTTLIGNPYPSAIDAYKFIDDNVGVIDGTLYFWHQWAGNSHNLAEYEGGYALINKMAKIRAYQFVGMSGADNGSQDGTLTPTRYIAAGQSFMTEVVADGEIEFNNGQRIFKREDLGETEFFRTAENTSVKESEDPIQILRLEFRTSNDLSREIALGFSEFTSNGFDYGYDGKMFDDKQEDIYTVWNGQKMITQAYPKIISKTRIPLGLNATGNYIYSIRATDFIGFNNGQQVYLKDNLKGTYFDLRSDQAYTFKSESGEFNDRFVILFKAAVNSTTKEVEVDNTVIYFNTNTDNLFVKGLNTTAKKLTLTNTLGQNILSFTNVSTQRLEDGLSITNLSSGIYMVRLTTATNKIIDKKILID